MRSVCILSASLGLLSSFAPAVNCQTQPSPPPAAPSRAVPQVTLQVKDMSLSARRTASPTKVADLDLLQKGYVLIGSVSVDWRLNQSEVSAPDIRQVWTQQGLLVWSPRQRLWLRPSG